MKNISSYIDNTLLRPDAIEQDFVRLLDESMEAQFYAVCIPPQRVAWAQKYIASSVLKICTVIGFPYGYCTSETRYRESCEAVEKGADELDIVMPVGLFKDGRSDCDFSGEIERVKKATGSVIKVIIETPFLSDEEIFRASHLCSVGKADFVKTCTGIHGGAVLKSIPIIREAVGSSVEIKASGGIGSYGDALDFIEQGVTRIGTSKGHKIWKESIQN